MEVSTDTAIIDRMLQASGAKNDSELSRMLGLTTQAVSKARNGNKVPPGWVPQIAQKFGVSTDWLFFGLGPMRMGNVSMREQSSAEGFVGACTCGCDVDLVMIPRVAARLTAGSGSLETSGEVLGTYAFRSDWIVRKGNTSKMVLMEVIGDSMMPEIKHGDIVLIDQSKTNILGYGYFAVGIDEAVYVKQLRPKPGKLILHSLNPDYDDIEVDMAAEQPQDVRIIGRVLWVGRELD